MSSPLDDLDEKVTEFAPSGFFVLRTPLLPYEEFRNLGRDLVAIAATKEVAAKDLKDDLDAALIADRRAIRARLLQFIERPEVREALYIATPGLERDLAVWMREPDGAHGQKIERALFRYVVRMASRATPFGLFAGCSVGKIGAVTRLELLPREAYRRHTRLDNDYLDKLSDGLSKLPALREDLPCIVSSSLYRIGGRLRYAEANQQGPTRRYNLVDVLPTPYLDATLAMAAQGSTRGALARMLVERERNVTLPEALTYIDELLQAQILCPILAPFLTGHAHLREYIRSLGALPAAAPYVRSLEGAYESLSRIDAGGVGVEVARYDAVAKSLEPLPAKIDPSRLLQVDLFKPDAGASIGDAVMKEIRRGIELLHRIGEPPALDGMKRFRDRFRERYEDREVPFVEVLDEELGIGFEPGSGPRAETSPLLQDLEFPEVEQTSSSTWSARDRYLLWRLGLVLQRGEEVLTLDEQDLKMLEVPKRTSLPDAFAVTATLCASAPALDSNNFRIVFSSISGPSGGKLLGRFCHLDAALTEHVLQHLRAEEALRPNALFAEVVHLPEGRIGNVLTRPVLRSYELPFLARSSIPAAQQIPITDLLLSVRQNKVRLRSRRLGKEIIPRLTSAHNFSGSRNLGIYRFLCALQGQGVAMHLAWRWGPLDSAPFCPRVVYGRLILARATWTLRASQLLPIATAGAAQRFSRMQELREKLRLPRLVDLREGDNILPIDLDNVIAIDVLLQLGREREQIILMEHLPQHDELCARGPEGHFTHELIIPFVKEFAFAADSALPRPVPEVPEIRLPRSFGLGSEWLYMKLYTGTATLDRILRERVAPLIAEWSQNGVIDRWFFIRYQDPDWHLRLRVQTSAEKLHRNVLPALYNLTAQLQTDGLIFRHQCDTYVREIERYGGDAGMLVAEEIFHWDSEAVLAILQRLSGDGFAEVRWQLTLRGIDMLLSDLGLSLTEKLSVVSRARDALGIEHRVNATFSRNLGAKYRKLVAGFETLLISRGLGDSPIDAGVVLLSRRSRRVAPAINKLQSLAAQGALSSSVETLAGSYIHMHANRMLRSAARSHELVLYDFLSRLYQSRLSRKAAT